MKTAGKIFGLVNVLILISASLLGLFNFASSAKAQDYPTKPVNLILPFAAGGGTDTIVRGITPGMEKALKTSIVIQYKTGGGGTIGWSQLARSKPDGYTIGTYSFSLLLQQYTEIGGIKIDQFDLIANVAFSEGVLSVRSESPFKNIKDLLDYAKKNPEVVTVSNSGTGGVWHLLAAGVAHQAGVKFTHVPMTGGGPATLAMLGGHVTMSSGTVSEVYKFVEAGKARVLGVASETRSPVLPNSPTLKEQGIDFVWGTPIGFMAPKGTPEKYIQILSDASQKGYETDEYQKIMRSLGHRTLFYDYKKMPQVMKGWDAQCLELLKVVGLAKQ